MTEETNPTIQKYVELKQQIAELEAELDQIKDEVLKAVTSRDGEIAGENYVLKTTRRAKFKFSDEYENKNKELKELRKTEIDSGTATPDGFTEYVSIRFKK
jgi:septal ring factor EnvC (AmiA/AmiB activator)